ncbi:DnaJ C-terminal domain-containing protein [Roseateles saccharophilus]|uniref:Curved DNA-binding protein n=1 Tax=Roseateles saccharophilus TaxID=304 RepID=A0A4R3V5S9_ROSSA|nr:DnaJ C-terminal domain-containing protein [Roseateles saccharophilus]MDG0835154.1 J domain-containing protein [Roseateles saccharophilus]TCU98753.1 curved DNA-binding protein [Roseateles saccharophilus]
MKFKDYYEVMGLAREATADEIKQAYRKLARKYHPDVSKEADAEARFKAIGEAYEVLRDPEKRAAYDGMGRHRGGEDFQPPPDWDAGYEFRGRGDPGEGIHDYSDFFESLFGRSTRGPRTGTGPSRRGAPRMDLRGEDHHAKVVIELQDAYTGAQRGLDLRMPAYDPQGHVVMQERSLQVNIPKGIRAGQQLRLAGQGGPGLGEGPAGDLYLEIEFRLDPRFRVDGRDIYMDMPLAPWEAALGASVRLATPDGSVVELGVPAGSAAGRKLRLRGRGIPGDPAGDLYAVASLVLPPARDDASRQAYEALRAAAGAGFDPRRSA